jgi:hypothetical protein
MKVHGANLESYLAHGRQEGAPGHPLFASMALLPQLLQLSPYNPAAGGRRRGAAQIHPAGGPDRQLLTTTTRRSLGPAATPSANNGQIEPGRGGDSGSWQRSCHRDDIRPQHDVTKNDHRAQ